MLDELRVEFCVVRDLDRAWCFEQATQRRKCFVRVAVSEVIEVDDVDAIRGGELDQSEARGIWIEIGGFGIETDYRLRFEDFNCFPKLIGDFNNDL